MTSTMGPVAPGVYSPAKDLDRATVTEHFRGRELTPHPMSNRPPTLTSPMKGATTSPVLANQQAMFQKAPKFDGNTSYKQEYTEKPLGPYDRAPQVEWQPSPYKMAGSTAYRDEFAPKPMPPMAEYEPVAAKPSPHKFDGSTTYGKEFAAKPMDPPQPLPKVEWQPSPHKMASHTAYRDEFAPKPMPPRPEYAPVGPVTSPHKLDGVTTYGKEFSPKKMEPAAALPKVEWKPSPYKMAGSTAYRDEFAPKPMPPMAEYEPVAAKPSPHKFDGSTTYGKEFAAKPMDPPQPLPKVEWQPSPHKMSNETSNRIFFKGWKLPVQRTNIGIETYGGKFYILLPSDAPLPCSSSQVFTTVHDDQQEVCVIILQGMSPYAHANAILGQFDLVGIPPGPAGRPQIKVEFSISDDSTLQVTAEELETGRHQDWVARGGAMLARVDSKDNYGTLRLPLGSASQGGSMVDQVAPAPGEPINRALDFDGGGEPETPQGNTGGSFEMLD